MKVSSLFNIVADGNDVLEFFDRVETVDQLISRLERLKRQGAEELLLCLDGLRSSITKALDDTLEMNSAAFEYDEEEEEPEFGDLDSELASLEEENQNPAENPPAEVTNKVVSPTE
jgi:hypothetical protein